MAWTRHQYRGHKVWILVDEEGRPTLDARGLAEMRYQQDDPPTYTVRPSELRPLEGGPPVHDGVDGWVHVVRTDDGRASVGAVLTWRRRRRELARHLGPTAGPGAATALGVAAVLDAIRRKDVAVRIHVQGALALERVHAGRGAGSASPAARRLRAAASRLARVTFVVPGEAREIARARELTGPVHERR